MPFYDDEGDGYRGDGNRYPRRQHSPPLHTEKVVTDRKIFFLDLKENERGRVLKITEDVRGRRDTIMVPVEALREFIDALQRIDDAHNSVATEAGFED
jgi:hypothetical protein